MIQNSHLWAVGFEGTHRAEQVCDVVKKLAEEKTLVLVDTAVAVHYADGIITVNGEPFLSLANFGRRSIAGYLAGLALGAPPLVEPAASALARAAGGTAAEVGISGGFIDDVQALIKPGTSALFVLDQEGNLPMILTGIQGLGGTVLKSNVDAARVRLIQSTLAAADNYPGDRR